MIPHYELEFGMIIFGGHVLQLHHTVVTAKRTPWSIPFQDEPSKHSTFLFGREDLYISDLPFLNGI